MKKILLIFIAALSLACLMGCDHSHKKGELSFDEKSHWYSCKNKDCDEKIESEEHIWGQGVVTKEPSSNGDGEKAYLCTVCKYVKTEKITHVPQKTVTSEQWDRAFLPANFHNVTATLTETISMGDTAHKTEYTILANQLVIYLTTVKYVNGEEVSYSARLQDGYHQWTFTSREQKLEDATYNVVDSSEIMSADKILEDYSLNLEGLFGSFAYNRETECYEADSLSFGKKQMTSLSVSFSDSKIAKLSATTSEGMTVSIAFTNYGKTEPQKAVDIK